MIEENQVKETQEETKTEQVDIKSLVDIEVSKAIKNIKGNLDSAYSERDAALAEVEKAKGERQKVEIEA